MNRLLQNIPIELYYHILSYSYNPQPKNLQKDIISYVKTKREITSIFYRRYHKIDVYKHLSFHIQSYLTGLSNIYNINCKTEQVCNRLFIWNKLLTLDKNLCFSHHIFWGLLTIEEREQFIQIHKEMDENRMP